ncbi:hypothetical protein ABZ726_10580 [Streptomyces hundungensis]|uniref:hypothetical protein n=1 Tax=Streptomyces hundungensis TaxID=1077946 RepID=UPI0033ED2FAC
MHEEGTVDWPTVIAPICGMGGIIVGAWFNYRQARRRGDTDERVATVQATITAQTADGQTYVEAMKTVTSGFASLLDQQRGVLDQQKTLLDQERTMHAQTVDRVTQLEAGQLELQREVRLLQEEQRRDRRWKAAALDYIHSLLDALRSLGRPTPQPPAEIAADITSPQS